MADYCSVADVRYYRPETSNTTPGGTDAAVTFFIQAEAMSWVNGKLRDHYTVPFTTVDGVVRILTAKIAARCLIFAVYGKNMSHWGAVKGYYDQLLVEAEKTVEQIKSGDITLSVDMNVGSLVTTNIPADAEEIVHATDEEQWEDIFESDADAVSEVS